MRRNRGGRTGRWRPAKRGSRENEAVASARPSEPRRENNLDRVCHNKLYAEQQQRNESPEPNKIKTPCLLAQTKTLRVRRRRARRWRETPRHADERTPVGARRARLSRKAVEKSSTKPGIRTRLKSSLNSRRNRRRMLRSQASLFIVYMYKALRSAGGLRRPLRSLWKKKYMSNYAKRTEGR